VKTHVPVNCDRMDPRCFVDHFNALASVTQNIHMNVQRLQHTVNDIRRNQQCGSIVESFMLKNFHKVMRSVERIENRVVEQVPESGAPRLTQDGVIKFSISSKGLTNQTSLTDVTVAFFTDNYPAGFALDKDSDSWKDLDLTERKKLRNHFGTIKRAVRMVLMHTDSFPPPRPDGSSESWKESLRGTATAAEQCIREDFSFGDKTISIYKLTSHPLMKYLEKSLKLPENTPECFRKIFKSD
jgi:hypothetical protein